MNTAIQWSGPLLACGAIMLGLSIVAISFRPVVNQPASPGVATLLLLSAAEDIAIRRYGEQGNNIVHWSDFTRGGHFAALEAPDLLVDDIRDFFGKLRRS